MTTPDTRWAEWSVAWRESRHPTPGVGIDVRQRVDRESAKMRWTLGAEVVVTAAVLAAVWTVLAAERGVVALGWAAAAGLHTGVVWAFTIWNRIGVWRPLGHSTQEYFRLTRLRLERQRRSADFTLGLIGVEVVALGALATQIEWPRGRGWVWLPAVFVTGTAVAWAFWSRRRTAAELNRLSALESQWMAEGAA